MTILILQQQVKNFLRQMWFKQREDERRRKEAVAAQTMACVEKVRIPCGKQGQCVPYGLLCTDWRDTVKLSIKLDLPLHLLYPDVLHYRAVKEVHVQELAQRLRDDVQLRWQVINACSLHLPQHEQGQARLSAYLHFTRWLPLKDNVMEKWEHLLAQGDDGGEKQHGVVEHMFITFASLLPSDKWSHVYAWCIAFRVHSTDAGAFLPSGVNATSLPAHEELVDWLLQYYDPEWSCEEEVALKHLSTAWRRHYESKADVLPPTTTCSTYDAFEAATAATLPPPAPPASDSQSEERGSGLLRMSRKSALYPPMFCDPHTLTFV